MCLIGGNANFRNEFGNGVDSTVGSFIIEVIWCSLLRCHNNLIYQNINILIFEAIIVVTMTSLVIGKFYYEDKIWIRHYRKLVLGIEQLIQFLRGLELP